MWKLLGNATTVRFRARIYSTFPLDGCSSDCASNADWSKLIRGAEWAVEAAWPNFLRIEKLRRADHDPGELSLAVPGDLVISDGTQLLELDLVRSLFVTAPAPQSLEDLGTRTGLHPWFAPDVIFASDPFAKLGQCEDPDPEISEGMGVYRLKHLPGQVLRLNAATGWPHSLSEYRLKVEQRPVEVSRTEFYGWQRNAELAPFVYEA